MALLAAFRRKAKKIDSDLIDTIASDLRLNDRDAQEAKRG
jgi:hypothetical protein